jgi:histone-lysine N-methyltransferase SETD3
MTFNMNALTRHISVLSRLQGIPAGAQVYDSYGQKCNHRFLLNYGFAVEDNRELDGFCPNEVPIDLSVSPSDPLYSKKLEFWTRGEADTHVLSSALAAAMSDPQTAASALEAMRSAAKYRDEEAPVKRVRVCVSNNENTRLLFSLLRSLACNEEELTYVSSSMADGAVGRALFGLTDQRTPPTFYRSCRDIRHPISLRNERAAMMLLLENVGQLLSGYPNSLAQDAADLCDEVRFPRFSNQRHAKIQVRGEKEVLHHFAVWARTAIEVMDVIEAELKGDDRASFDAVIAAMIVEEGVNGVHHTVLRYCEDVLGALRREEYKAYRRRTTSTASSTTSISARSSDFNY